jgi:predicted short-subunit dehydrogenase-like oxidoreductase (DUF2520 family)
MAHYLIVGSGRTARHFSHYFQGLGLPFDLWNRHEPWARLQECVEKATHVLLLISDSALEAFYKENLGASDRLVIHFSGALEVSGIQSAHPLMTFSQDLYALETYRRIPFVTTSKIPFESLLPGVPNSAFRILPEQKPLYHALCVLSGNFTTLLWQKMAQGMTELGLPAEIQIPYMNQIFKNLEKNPAGALTGPLARKDFKTVLANDQALAGDPMRLVYRAFVQAYFPEATPQLEGAP